MQKPPADVVGRGFFVFPFPSSRPYTLRIRPPILNRRNAVSNRRIIATDQAPQAIGSYSQAIKAGTTVYLSGQIPLVPATMEMVEGDMEARIRQVFDNLAAVAAAAGGSLADIVKLNVFLTDLGHFPLLNQVMAEYFEAPYPARAAVGVAALPKDAGVEMDAVMELSDSGNAC